MISKKSGGASGTAATRPPNNKEGSVCCRNHAPQEGHHQQNFLPLRTTMDTYPAGAEGSGNKETVPGKTNRARPIILTSQENLSQLQKQLKNVVKRDF
jgi:hypothetical protein